jgi:predicted MFS family arabinose efflux permease
MITAIRMMYPFAPAMARGLGVELSAIYNLITIRNFTGFFSPLLEPLSARFGRKPVIILSVLLFSLSCLLLLLWASFWLLGAVLVLTALAKVIFDPPMQSYVGDTVAYSQRGKAFAITELSWAGGLLVGAPVVGLSIQYYGWRSPFLWLAFLGLLAALLLWRAIPRHKRSVGSAAGLRQTVLMVRRYPVVWAAAIYTMLVMGANETFFIVYGEWMESSFDLRLASLGLASGIIGGAEIMAELFAGWSVDRFGKRPVIIATGLLNALVYLVIPYTSNMLYGALLALFALFLFFETSVVGAVPLLTELVPTARGAVMAMVMAFGALGRSLGDLLGPQIWFRTGLAGTGFTAAIITVVAMLFMAKWVREGTGVPH